MQRQVEKPTPEPMMSVADLTRWFGCSRRLVERARANGTFPKPDLMLGRLPRWKPETVRAWVERGGSQ